MRDVFSPVLKHTLSDELVSRIRAMIRKGDYQRGDRLPSILEMARRFGVGHPTIREALKKLETMGYVEVRHGSGVYVSRSEEVLLVASPDFSRTATKKLLVDLIRTRVPLETQSVANAVEHGTADNLAEMHRLLTIAGEHLDNDDVLHEVNTGFHREIARASGNAVLGQILDALHDLFAGEQRLIIGIFAAREVDHRAHLGILEAIERRDAALGVDRMRKHLQDVMDSITSWNPDDHPVG